jgi:hypothetical protein
LVFLNGRFIETFLCSSGQDYVGENRIQQDLKGRGNPVISQGDEPKPRYGIASLERRKHKRYLVNLPVEYYRVDSPSASSGQMGNVSEGGLMLYSNEKMEVGQQLKLKIFFSRGLELDKIEALGELVWVAPLVEEKWGSHSWGVKFVEMSSEDLTKLEEFLKTITP